MREAHVHEDIGIVTNDARITLALAVMPLNVDLEISASHRRGIPAYAVHVPFPHKPLIAGAAKFAGIAFEDEDVLRFDPGALQAGDRFQNHRRIGNGSDAARAGLADRVDFDAYDIARLKEPLPRFRGMLRARQFAHAALDHRLDCGRIDGGIRPDRIRMSDLNDAPGERPWHTKLCRLLRWSALRD